MDFAIKKQCLKCLSSRIKNTLNTTVSVACNQCPTNIFTLKINGLRNIYYKVNTLFVFVDP
jgi:hypothetical protein